MKRETIAQMESYFAETPVLRGGPASEEAISEAQRRLGCRFAPDYVEFLGRFGCGIVGPDPIFGIGPEAVQALAAGDDVVTQTERYRGERWPGVADWYIVSCDARGNPVGIAPDGKVRLSDHDVGDTPVIAESFEAFLVKNLSR